MPTRNRLQLPYFDRPGRSLAMIDRHRTHPAALANDQRRQEPMHVVEVGSSERNRARGKSFSPQPLSGVPSPSRRARTRLATRDAARPAPVVVPGDPVSDQHERRAVVVGPAGQRPQRGDVVRIVSDHRRPASAIQSEVARAHAAVQRRALAAVPGVAEHAQARLELAPGTQGVRVCRPCCRRPRRRSRSRCRGASTRRRPRRSGRQSARPRP